MFYNFPGAPGNTGYQAQANPNPLMVRHPHINPSKIQVPLASSNGMVPMGNAGFFAASQYEQQMPTGFQNKTVS